MRERAARGTLHPRRPPPRNPVGEGTRTALLSKLAEMRRHSLVNEGRKVDVQRVVLMLIVQEMDRAVAFYRDRHRPRAAAA